jgi:alpha-tubulin suppressor-like RCC1 family protein
VQVQGLSGVVAVAAGEQHSLALRGDGAVFAWGLGVALGNGSTTSSSVPVSVSGLGQGVVDLRAGGRHSAALKTDGATLGRLWDWGLNSAGQLGDGTTSNRLAPVAGLAGLSVAVAGFNQGHALDPEGKAWGWGGLVGDGDYHTRPAPVRLSAAAALLAVSDGSAHDLAVGPEGHAWSWGTTTAALGDGQPARYAPAMLDSPVLADGAWALQDADADGLPNWVELRLETDPLDADTNDDGLSDGAAWRSGRSPTADDMDGDGLGNGRERLLGTDPFRADTDGDGVLDGADAFPLDPTRWDGSPQPGDSTPPAVTLTEPAQAVLLP